MRVPAPLPPRLAGALAFTVADADAQEVGRSRLRRSDLIAVHHGVRATREPRTFEERVSAYLPRLRPGRMFSHATAAGIRGTPVPQHLLDGPLHVGAIHPAHAPRVPGVIGHRLRDRPGLLDEHLGHPVTDALETFCLLGPALSLADLVAAGDHPVRKGVEDPLPILDALHATIRSFRRAGSAHLECAAGLVRPGVRSAMESRLRVVVVLAGLPEPEVNVQLFRRDGGWLGEGDLVYRRKRQVLEYDGDGHRTDRKQFRKDITRREEFEDEGWGVIRVTADDVFLHRRELLQRIARRLDIPFP